MAKHAKRRVQSPHVLGYTEEEIDDFRDHLVMHLGDIGDHFLHDKASLCGIHIDIVPVQPIGEGPFFKNSFHMVTMGAGAYLMPDGDRAEYVITLPSTWPMDMKSWQDERNYWPIRLLQDAARFPVTNKTSLDWFHTLDNQEPYSVDTQQCACVFMPMPGFGFVQLSSGKTIKILQIVPIYRSELDMCKKIGNGIAIFDLIRCLGDSPLAISPQRPPCA